MINEEHWNTGNSDAFRGCGALLRSLHVRNHSTLEEAVREELQRAFRAGKASGLTKVKLAEAMECTPEQVGHLLSGERTLSFYWFEKMCAGLGLEPAEVLRKAVGK